MTALRPTLCADCGVVRRRSLVLVESTRRYKMLVCGVCLTALSVAQPGRIHAVRWTDREWAVRAQAVAERSRHAVQPCDQNAPRARFAMPSNATARSDERIPQENQVE